MGLSKKSWVQVLVVINTLGTIVCSAAAQQPHDTGGSPPAPPAAAASTAPPAPAPDADVDELIGDLLTSEEKDPDLEWLYSDAYEPSALGGDPIPAPALPSKGEGSTRTWNPRWRRFSLGNYILTGSAAAIAIGSTLISPASERWNRTNSFDESVRNAIGITGYSDGMWARDVSDLLLSVSVAYPVLFDTLIVTYWYRASPEVAQQMALISAEAFAVASALHGMTAGFGGRERPYVRNCGTNIDGNLDDCSGRKPYRSFFSGHTAMSFTGAGLACSHHIHHDVFGDGPWDGIACATAMTAAATVGAMRIVGDQHYMTPTTTSPANNPIRSFMRPLADDASLDPPTGFL